MSKFLEKQLEKNLALALLNFKNEKEIIEFLKSFLTKKEFETLSKRINILYWLNKKRSEENILINLSVTKTTINKTKKLLKEKKVNEALKNIDADEWSEKWSKKIKGLVKSP